MSETGGSRPHYSGHLSCDCHLPSRNRDFHQLVTWDIAVTVSGEAQGSGLSEFDQTRAWSSANLLLPCDFKLLAKQQCCQGLIIKAKSLSQLRGSSRFRVLLQNNLGVVTWLRCQDFAPYERAFRWQDPRCLREPQIASTAG